MNSMRDRMAQPLYKRILVVVDSRAVSRVAVNTGIALAASHQAHLVFFHVMPRYSIPMADMPPFVSVSPEEFLRDAKSIAERLLTAACSAAKRSGVQAQTASGSGEDDARCIAEAARKRRCDLIVVASEGRNALLRLLTGSVIPGLITAAPMPVLVVKESTRSTAAESVSVAPVKPRRAGAKVAARAPLTVAKPRRQRVSA